MEAAGLSFPKPILCPHENTAMHMAGGYALATGRGQGVMVHVDVAPRTRRWACTTFFARASR